MAAGSKFARNSPLLGEAFFTSAITAGLPAAIFARSAAENSRSGGAAALRARKSDRLTRRLRSATSSALRHCMRCSMSDILFNSPAISKLLSLLATAAKYAVAWPRTRQGAQRLKYPQYVMVACKIKPLTRRSPSPAPPQDDDDTMR